ncbi:hypothetical protein PHMEG_00019855 [Phytophthora megakarya]|uniref:PiggyBac transposable element-derived protein domain-containing protein n=1 Tax=Phytophthora megakarya TaxID=4795 RepID=A0A225VQI0_9STRA|nr:hypothetical protein PHMEG_00019855 [Phytophthora megakarya]
MRVLRWWDTRAIHMLSMGGSLELGRILRRDKLSGEQHEVVCPRIVKGYQTYMGVDVYNQLQLQSFASSTKFLRVVDLAIIYAYIVHNAGRHAANYSKLKHVKVLKQLHLALCDAL